MITRNLRKFAAVLSPEARKSVHGFADHLLAPIGSANGAKNATSLVALTFDDGPDPVVTPAMLDLLRARSTVATFFVLTERAAKYPELIRRMIDEGHEVGLHCDRHDRLTRLPAAVVEKRLSEAKRLLESIAGRAVTRFRPPFGSQGLPTIFVAKRLSLEIVVWGPIAEDWIEQSPQQAAARLLASTKGGDITLLHDGLEVPDGEEPPSFDRVKMLELILDGLEARGLQGTSVDKMNTAAGLNKTFWVRP